MRREGTKNYYYFDPSADAIRNADEKVSAKAGMGFYAKVDLGIVKYHFELGSGKKL